MPSSKKRRSKVLVWRGIGLLFLFAGLALTSSGCKQAGERPPEPEPVVKRKPVEPLRLTEGQHEMQPPEMPTGREDSRADSLAPDWIFDGDLNGAVLEETQKVFAGKCAGCHGEKGKGDGPMAARLPEGAPDLTRKETKALSDGELLRVIQEGRMDQGKMMPPFKSLSEGQQKNLVGYVRWLQTGK